MHPALRIFATAGKVGLYARLPFPGTCTNSWPVASAKAIEVSLLFRLVRYVPHFLSAWHNLSANTHARYALSAALAVPQHRQCKRCCCSPMHLALHAQPLGAEQTV